MSSRLLRITGVIEFGWGRTIVKDITMLRKTGLLSVLALAGLAAPLHAEEHYVLLMSKGYFPKDIHVQVGDTIRFVNEGSLPMSATATDDSWSTGIMVGDAQVVIPVTEGMKQTFVNKATSVGFNGQEVNTAPDAVGVIDYYNVAFVKLTAEGLPDDAIDADYAE